MICSVGGVIIVIEAVAVVVDEDSIVRGSNGEGVVCCDCVCGGVSGAIYTAGSWNSGRFLNHSGSNTTQAQQYFDASRCSSIYSGDGTDTKIHEEAIKVLYYIVIATSTKTDIQVDIDEIATDLNGKADVDLTNVNNAGTSLGAGWAMPSDTYIDLTLGASGTTYTAPANGWFVGRMTSTSSAQILGLVCMSGGNIQSIKYSSGNNQNLAVFLPSEKNDMVELWYGTTPQVFRFVYAKGSESEAS